MRAVCWNGKHDMRVEVVPDPEIVNPRDAIIRVTLTAIWGLTFTSTTDTSLR